MADIKLKYEFIHFTQLPQPSGRKTKKWAVYTNDGHRLGKIIWRSGWRRLIFEPCTNTIYDAKCLSDIVDFISLRMIEQKASWKYAKQKDNRSNNNGDSPTGNKSE